MGGSPGWNGIMEMLMQKQVGKRKNINFSVNGGLQFISEADQWLRTVERLRCSRGVCKKGLHKFRTFEEADQWMEMMILRSTQEFPL